MGLPFVKMHGLGNDFVVMADKHLQQCADLPKFARQLLDRRFGVGGDGLLIVGPPSENSHLTMRIFNSDGSESGMCGNGVRCAALLSSTDSDLVTISIGDRIVKCRVNKAANEVAVDMGFPDLLPEKVPIRFFDDSLKDKKEVIEQSIEFGSDTFYITAVSMGNPHCVIFFDSLDGIQIEKLGQLIEHHPIFPERTNVEFVLLKDPNVLDLIVWERGAGRTLACGSGACAAAVAAILTSRCKPGKVRVNLPGGSLDIIWEGRGKPLEMIGAATETFRGEIAFS